MKSKNPVLTGAVALLEKHGRKSAAVWGSASELLSRGSASRVEVNVGHLSRMAEKKQRLFVPGKVLGGGGIDKELVVGAYSFSSRARSKIEAAGGEALGVQEFLKRYTDGSGVVLVS